MSTLIRYEIEVHFASNQDEPALSQLTSTLREAIAKHPESGFQPEADAWAGGVNFSGEENDWSRDHDARHRAVVEAVASVLPDARVQTRWLNLEWLDWDESFDTDDDDDDDEDGGEAEADRVLAQIHEERMANNITEEKKNAPES